MDNTSFFDQTVIHIMYRTPTETSQSPNWEFLKPYYNSVEEAEVVKRALEDPNTQVSMISEEKRFLAVSIPL